MKWLDATGGLRTGWRSLKSINLEPEPSETVGFLLRESKKAILVVPHRSGPDEGDGEICILKDTIEELVDLVPSRKKYGGHVG